MINHARTLLLNYDGQPDFRPLAGEEIVPPGFRAVTLPSYLGSIKAALFNSSPDRHYRNFWAKRYMQILHASELEEYVLSLDPRTTYLNVEDNSYFDSAFGATVTQKSLAQLPRAFYFVGTLTPDEGKGRLFHEWRVEVADSENVLVERYTSPGSSITYPYTMTNSLSDPITLTGSSLKFRFEEGAGSIWFVTGVARPTRTVTDVYVRLAQGLSQASRDSLFGSKPVEPYLTFRNLWDGHDYFPYRLGGFLLAYIYRVHEIWRP